MKNFYSKLTLPFIVMLMLTLNNYAQQNGYWKEITKPSLSSKTLAERKSIPNKANFYTLNINQLNLALKNVPDRKNIKKLSDSDVIIEFPNATGKFESYRVMEASIMASELQNKYPDIRSYIGVNVQNPARIIRFSITPKGLHTMILGNDLEFIDPYSKVENIYIVYAKKNLPVLETPFICNVTNDETTKTSVNSNKTNFNANDGILRDYRLALACTIEYAEFHWKAAGLTTADSEADKKKAVMAAMVVTMTRVNGIYEKDLSLTMTFVPNNTDIIFIIADTYSNDNGLAMLAENQATIDLLIGRDNYDIGHVFSTGGGGVASLNSPCTIAQKAQGVTGLSAPTGDPFDVDYVAHEMGHQWGAPHTFNGDEGSCSSNRTSSNAYEPGSGTTIMAYAGICEPQNVQKNSDAYFHQKSLQMMWSNITTGNSTCSTNTITGNTVPVAIAGNNYTIPMKTPYKLTGASTDVDGTDSHTYTWEQYDLGPAGVPTETTASGPLVRSFEGTINPTRYIPNLPDLYVSKGSTDWEKLSAVNRDINFKLTIRDNDPRGGQTAVDGMTVTVTTNAGPFKVTSQNTTDIIWAQGTTETITWDVAGTTENGINATNVNILLSTDGGLTYNTMLLTNTPNDGSQDITVPNITASSCRVMVEAVGNIFFSVNDEDFAIDATASTNKVVLENTLKIYPNPNNGTFNLSFNSKSGKDIIISVYDIRGRMVLNKLYPNNGDVFNETVNLNNTQSGMYLLKVSDGYQAYTKKIIVD